MLVSDVVYDKKDNPIDLERLFRIQGYTCEASFESTAKDRGRFSVLYLDPSDDNIFSIQFNLSKTDEDDGLPSQSIFYIEEMYSEGIGTKIVAKLLELADRCGIKRLEVSPLEVGGYFWGRVGFVPVEEQIGPLSKMLEEKTDGAVKFSNADEFREIVKTKAGKEALLDTDWYGAFDLTDRAQMEFWKGYKASKLER